MCLKECANEIRAIERFVFGFSEMKIMVKREENHVRSSKAEKQDVGGAEEGEMIAKWLELELEARRLKTKTKTPRRGSVRRRTWLSCD